MNELEEYEIIYKYNNINYNIVATNKTHVKLKNDKEFFKAYISSNINLCKTTNITKKVNDLNIENFVWTEESIKLLLQKYNDRKNKFRDPKIKKKLLWLEIVEEFKIKGYNVNEAVLNSKMRNLKLSYKNIKNNNKKTCTNHSRNTWKWYKTMENLFKEDRTVNVGAMLPSMINSVNNLEGSTSIPSISIEGDGHINTVHKDIYNINSCETIGQQKQVNDFNIENFAWTNQTIKLLLQKYYDRNSKFRDPKIKKKLLWMEIVEEFKIKGYNVNETILDNKMRNLKQSYENIKNNNNKTSTGRCPITWKWYNTMEDLFKEDQTINVGATLSSMINSINNLESFTPIPPTSIENEEHVNPVYSDIDNINLCEAIGIQKEVNDINIENFAWTNQTTKLLLQKYNDRKSKFRDPKIKKKLLWMEIVEEFKIKGYNVNEAIVDRKMRNLKQSYKSIKDNNKKTSTGRNRITWKWYDTMEDLFNEDRAMNVGATLSFVINSVNIKEGSTSILPTSTEDDVHVNAIHSGIDNINACETIGIQKEVNDMNIENFAWTNQTTKLLLQKYNDRKSKFRDPKIKKKLLWMEIVEEFKIKGYNVNSAILDRKMRNLKQSYKSIRDKKKTSTGHTRITWKWYDTMDGLFKEDQTINVGVTLSSMINSIINEEGSTSIPSTSIEDDEHINTVYSDINAEQSKMTENFTESRTSISPVPDILSKRHPFKNLKEKATESRALYNIRKMMLVGEERRVDAINKLSEKIEEHNKIQRDAVAERTVWMCCFARFKADDINLKDQKHMDRPSIIDEDQIKTLIENNQRYTTRKLAKMLNMSKSTIHKHFVKLG
ncbi:reticulocyte-binding protein homolog 2b-like [Vespa velutina]|uniref:reticulocyte-binding protein homolog 2b-like n=1 Tax=Vespa velutina TaxID=202808 RepID=UPI001FB335A5|nr:reticulocyte-binding protein homolog 2b-like [Vespa velutina]